jgi:hypothetical protein
MLAADIAQPQPEGSVVIDRLQCEARTACANRVIVIQVRVNRPRFRGDGVPQLVRQIHAHGLETLAVKRGPPDLCKRPAPAIFQEHQSKTAAPFE